MAVDDLLRPYMQFLEAGRVAHLATASLDGNPHVVPICYACAGDALYTAIDEKPKKGPPAQLKRLRNIAGNPPVAVIVDRYSENWDELGYVLIHGTAALVANNQEHARALELLRARYPQYTGMRLESRPMIRITPTEVSAWGRVRASGR